MNTAFHGHLVLAIWLLASFFSFPALLDSVSANISCVLTR